MSIKKLLIVILLGLAIATPAFAASWSTFDQAWIAPGTTLGAANCNAMSEIADGRYIDTLKPQYWAVHDDGTLVEDTVASAGCNGYSTGNASLVKQYSKNQYITVSGSLPGWPLLAASPSSVANATSTLTNFVVDNGFTGIELDWESYTSWTSGQYTNYKSFLTSLASALHAQGKKLMVDGPPLRSQPGELFIYSEVAPLVDYVVALGYDFQTTAGTDISPSSSIRQMIAFISPQVSSTKLIIGMPSYGYHGPTNSTPLTQDEQAASLTYTGSSTAARDSSWEMQWTNSTTTYDFQDQSGMGSKRTDIEAQGGMSAISVWVLGGNAWFNTSIIEPGQTTSSPSTASTPLLTVKGATLKVVGATLTIK